MVTGKMVPYTVRLGFEGSVSNVEVSYSIFNACIHSRLHDALMGRQTPDSHVFR